MTDASEAGLIEVRIEGRVRVSAFAGDISQEFLRTFAATTMASPDYDPSLDSLVDMRGVTTMALDRGTVGYIERDYAARGAGLTPRRLAFVVDSPTTFGYARQFSAMHSGSADEVRVFEAVFDARRWLGLPNAEGAAPSTGDGLPGATSA